MPADRGRRDPADVKNLWRMVWVRTAEEGLRMGKKERRVAERRVLARRGYDFIPHPLTRGYPRGMDGVSTGRRQRLVNRRQQVREEG